MSSLVYSSHARARMQQRGLRERDVELIVDLGTRVSEDAYILRRQDVDREIELRRREIQALSRLRGRKVVVAADMVVTGYHPRPAVRRRDLRRGRENAWLYRSDRRNRAGPMRRVTRKALAAKGRKVLDRYLTKRKSSRDPATSIHPQHLRVSSAPRGRNAP